MPDEPNNGGNGDGNNGGGNNPGGGGPTTTAEEQRGNLRTRESRLREQEHEKRVRLSEIGDFLASRNLTPDEIEEQKTLERECGEIHEQRQAIKRQLQVGQYSNRLTDPIGLSDREMRDFSFNKLIIARSKGAIDADREAARMELEAVDAYSAQIKDAPLGFYVPPDVYGDVVTGQRAAAIARLKCLIFNKSDMAREAGRALMDLWGIEQRDLSADDFSGAGALVGVDWRPQSMIELLRNNQALPMLGATMLTGLVGDVAIPRQTGAGVVSWVPKDGADVGNTDQAVGQITMTPRTVGAYTDYTRALRLQSSVAVENFIRRDLMTEVALAEDRAAFRGTGVNGQPLGVKNVTGVGSVTHEDTAINEIDTKKGDEGDPTWLGVLELRKEIATDNALMGNLGFTGGATITTNMMRRRVDPGSGVFLADKLPYPLAESNQITLNELFFGNWSDVIVGEWGMLDILVDPYSRSTAGAVRVIIFHSCDVAVRHPESFAIFA